MPEKFSPDMKIKGFKGPSERIDLEVNRLENKSPTSNVGKKKKKKTEKLVGWRAVEAAEMRVVQEREAAERKAEDFKRQTETHDLN